MKLAIAIVLAMCSAGWGQTTQPSTQPATQPTAKRVQQAKPPAKPVVARRVVDLLEVIDKSDRPTSQEDWTTAHMDLMTQAMDEKARGKPFRIMAELVHYDSGRGSVADFSVKPFKWCGVEIETTLRLTWPQSQARLFKDLREGDRVEVMGAASNFGFARRSRSEKIEKRHVGADTTSEEKEVGIINISIQVVPDPAMVIKKK